MACRDSISRTSHGALSIARACRHARRLSSPWNFVPVGVVSRCRIDALVYSTLPGEPFVRSLSTSANRGTLGRKDPPNKALQGETLDSLPGPVVGGRAYSDELKNDPGPNYTGNRREDEKIFQRYYGNVLEYGKQLLESLYSGRQNVIGWKFVGGGGGPIGLPWFGRHESYIQAPLPHINPSYIKYPPGSRESWKHSCQHFKGLLVRARQRSLLKRSKYAKGYADCPTIYIRLPNGDFRAQIETDKYGSQEDIWDIRGMPIRGVPRFNPASGGMDPGPKYTGNDLRDFELLLGYYGYTLRVHHRFALQRLLWDPTTVIFERHHKSKMKMPASLQEWLGQSRRRHVVSTHASNLIKTVLRRNDMWNGIYDPTVEAWNLLIRATLEVLALLTACATGYYTLSWAYSKPDRVGESQTGPYLEQKRNSSEFRTAHPNVEETSDNLPDAKVVEDPAGLLQQPTSRWEQIRSHTWKKS